MEAQSLDFSDLGAKTVQPPPAPTGTPAPGVPAPAQASSNQDNSAPLDFSDLGARPVLAEPPAHEQPGFFERMYQTSGLKSMVDAAKARADEDEFVRTEALGHIKSNNWGSAAELLLKHIGKRAVTSDPAIQTIGGIAQNTYQHGKAAVQAARSGQTGEAIVQAAEAVPVVGSVSEQIGEPLGADLRNKNWSGAAGDVVSAGLQAALALAGGKASVAKAGDTLSAEETAASGLPLKAAGQKIGSEVKAAEQPATQFPRNAGEVQEALSNAAADNKGLPPKEAGQAVQQETQAARTAKGKQVGAAKEVLKKSLPTNVRSDAEYLDQALKEKTAEPDAGFVRNPYTDKEFGDLAPEQRVSVLKRAIDIKTSETGQIPFPKNGESVQTAKAIRDELGEEKLGLKDPNSPLGKLTNKLISGKNPTGGGDLSFSFEDADNARKALNQEIKSEYAKFKAGGDGTLYRRLVDLKSAFDEDLYNTWEEHGDAAAAQNVRQLGREYANIVKEQYQGAAKNLFKTQNPEKIIPNLVTTGAKAESTAQSLLKNMSASGKQTFADSLEREIYNRATKGDGSIDAVRGRDTLNKMGNTAKLILGDDRHSQLSTFLSDAGSKQGETGESVITPAQVNSPERLVYDIVSGGPKSQSTVEGLMSKLSPTSQKVLRDSALREIYRQNTFPNADIDMAGAQRDYSALGDTAKSLFGPDHAANSEFLSAAAQEQAARTTAANKPSLFSKGIKKATRMAGAGFGAYVGGPPGAAVGDILADSLFENGRSGAVRIGISPTDRIVLSPAAAAANRSLLTRFLRAKATGQTAAMTAAYNAIAKQNGDNQNDSGDQNQPSSSTGGSPIGSILAGGRL
jgi:hypothetical protein